MSVWVIIVIYPVYNTRSYYNAACQYSSTEKKSILQKYWFQLFFDITKNV